MGRFQRSTAPGDLLKARQKKLIAAARASGDVEGRANRIRGINAGIRTRQKLANCRGHEFEPNPKGGWRCRHCKGWVSDAEKEGLEGQRGIGAKG